MAIEHKNLVDPDIHEPKGVSSAASRQLYFANGGGSGSWRSATLQDISGVAIPNGAPGLKIVTTATAGVTAVLDKAYTGVSITGNSLTSPLTAAVDTTLVSNADYKPLVVTGATWTQGLTKVMTTSGGKIVSPANGIYKVTLQGTVNTMPTQTSKIAFKIDVGGVKTPMKVVIHRPGNFSLTARLNVPQGQEIYAAVASDTTGSCVLSDIEILAEYVEAT